MYPFSPMTPTLNQSLVIQSENEWYLARLNRLVESCLRSSGQKLLQLDLRLTWLESWNLHVCTGMGYPGSPSA